MDCRGWSHQVCGESNAKCGMYSQWTAPATQFTRCHPLVQKFQLDLLQTRSTTSCLKFCPCCNIKEVTFQRQRQSTCRTKQLLTPQRLCLSLSLTKCHASHMKWHVKTCNISKRDTRHETFPIDAWATWSEQGSTLKSPEINENRRELVITYSPDRFNPRNRALGGWKSVWLRLKNGGCPKMAEDNDYKPRALGVPIFQTTARFIADSIPTFKSPLFAHFFVPAPPKPVEERNSSAASFFSCSCVGILKHKAINNGDFTNQKEGFIYQCGILVGGIPTPLKNDGARQWDGWHPIYDGTSTFLMGKTTINGPFSIFNSYFDITRGNSWGFRQLLWLGWIPSNGPFPEWFEGKQPGKQAIKTRTEWQTNQPLSNRQGNSFVKRDAILRLLRLWSNNVCKRRFSLVSSENRWRNYSEEWGLSPPALSWPIINGWGWIKHLQYPKKGPNFKICRIFHIYTSMLYGFSRKSPIRPWTCEMVEMPATLKVDWTTV